MAAVDCRVTWPADVTSATRQRPASGDVTVSHDSLSPTRHYFTATQRIPSLYGDSIASSARSDTQVGRNLINNRDHVI